MQRNSEKDIAISQNQNDCLACQITGGAAFGGLGVYVIYQGWKNISRSRAHNARMQLLGIYGLGTCLIGVGIKRLLD